MLAEKKWYIINLKLRREQKTFDYLTRKKIEIYFPLNKIRKRQENKSSSYIYQPLFFHYAFVYITETEIAIVRHCEGVLHFLYWLGDYAIVSKEDINAVRLFLNIYQNVWLEKATVDTENNRPINIHGGINTYGYSKENNIEKLFLPTLGYFL
ncbi:MAG: transcription termination/antitermination NusG family protein, partial [Bacteroidota bacterium]